MRSLKDLPGIKQQMFKDLFQLLDDDTVDHHWACLCKRCKIWKRAHALGMVRERDNDER